MGMHVGIIGSGVVGRVHLEAMLAHTAVRAVSLAEPDEVSRQKAASELSIQRAEADDRTLLDDASIDVVDICLPHDLHHQVALEAFAAGKHVITEKPISNTLPEADEMIAAAEAAGRRFFVALNHLSVEFESWDYYRQVLGSDPVEAARLSLEIVRHLDSPGAD